MATKRQIEEAQTRMQALTDAFDLNEKLLDYLKQGKVYYSYRVSGMFGCIDTIEYDENNLSICKEFEQKTGAYVYHAIESETIYGKMLTLLHVSSEEQLEGWALEQLSADHIFAYVYNFSMDFGEYGGVFLSSDNGALVRVG